MAAWASQSSCHIASGRLQCQRWVLPEEFGLHARHGWFSYSQVIPMQEPSDLTDAILGYAHGIGGFGVYVDKRDALVRVPHWFLALALLSPSGIRSYGGCVGDVG
jgi:hypothetical protein